MTRAELFQALDRLKYGVADFAEAEKLVTQILDHDLIQRSELGDVEKMILKAVERFASQDTVEEPLTIANFHNYMNRQLERERAWDKVIPEFWPLVVNRYILNTGDTPIPVEIHATL